MKIQNKKILIGIILLLSIFSLFLIYRLKDRKLCSSNTYCIVYESDRGKVRKMNLNSEIAYNFITIEGKQIKKIEGLTGQTSLISLDLAGNSISKIEGLEDLTGLENLDLSDNEISKIEGLENLESLTTLFLQGNPITTLENIETIPPDNLESIYVPDTVENITQESYDYINAHNVKVYFIADGADVHDESVDKTIKDLNIE